MKYMFVIANYPDFRQQFFEEHYQPRMEQFCDLHDYQFILSHGAELFRGNPTWWKFTIIKQMLKDGMLKDGDEVLHLDADMRIDKFDKDYPCDKSFSICIDNGNSFCMGSYKMKINQWTRQLVDDILCEDLFQRNKDSHHWTWFREQAAFYTLCGIIPHSWESFLGLQDYGWHQYLTSDTKYSLKELHENVQVLRPEWNTTLLEEERDEIGSLMQYFITPSKKEDTIIRHYAGGQQWK